MKKIFVLMACSLLFFNSKGQAFDPAKVRQSAAYIQLYGACKSSPSTFENDYYIKVYHHSLMFTMQVFSLSKDAIYSGLITKGITPFLDKFLNDSSTIIALSDCLNESRHFHFVRNLIIVDSVGKAVGISIGTIVYLGIGSMTSAAFKFLLKPIARVSPGLANKISIITGFALAGLEIYNFKLEDEKEEQLSQEEGQRIMDGLNERLVNISLTANASKDTAADLQFDLSVEKAEKKEGRKLTLQEIAMFCQILPGAYHRCVH